MSSTDVPCSSLPARPPAGQSQVGAAFQFLPSFSAPVRLERPINQIKKVSRPKLWLQSLLLPEPAVPPQVRHLPFANLSFLAVAVGELGPHGCRQRACARSRPRPRTRGRAGGACPGEGRQPQPRRTCLGCPARPGHCVVEQGSVSGPGHWLRGVFSCELGREAPAHGDKAWTV